MSHDLSIYYFCVHCERDCPLSETMNDIHLGCGLRNNFNVLLNDTHILVSDAIYERWNKIPVSLKKKAAQLMHVCGFWYHILLCRGNHNTTRWAVQVGFIDSNVSNDLSLKRLHRIEILEAILRAMDKGCVVINVIISLFPQRSEEMKSKGNDHFQKKKYDSAVKCYSKAIKYNPYNHIIYGNRALCYIRCEKYLKAVGDGKRAALLQPEWAKGHYRYCEALFLLGERTRAMEANEWALTLCKSDPEGMKDLLQQHEKFLSEMEARRLSAEDRRGIGITVTQSCLHIDSNSGVPSLRDVLVSAVQEAHMALSDQRYHNAENAFSSALSILDTSTPKELGLCALDQVVLIYGHATALIQIGQPEKLAGALKDFEKIKTFEERTFHCLVFYGIGKVYQKENRFSVALEQFLNSMQVVKKNITPGKLTWPTTKVIVEETKPDYFKELLEDSIDMCRFPPNPDAICRHHSCHGHSKIEIYFTDPDFKGFIRMVCCQSCKVEYHISCWKKLKATVFPDKNEKVIFLYLSCSIKHYLIFYHSCRWYANVVFLSPTGFLAGNVLHSRLRDLKTLKAKEDRKLRRKQRRQEASINTQDKNDQRVLENQEAVASYEDRVLLQIHNSKELFRHESHNVSVLMKNLKPWMDLDQFKGNKLCMYARQPETLGAVVDILLERKNRVWARIFIQSLSSCLDTSPKLHDWAQELERAGLNAAGLFIDRYAAHLEQLDLAPLLSFPPVQDMLIEKFGTMPMFFSSHGLTVTEYLKQAPPHEKRLFIWTLEEHRDQYTSCHTVLDEYFEIMGKYLVFMWDKLTSVIVLSGMRGGASRDEDDDNFFDGDDSLLFGDLTDPFSVPHHLRHQVAEFEGQYNTGSHSSHYKRILDNNPDPTKESLYDYFAQILEKYGPLETQDPLLVGEFENFPPDTQMMIQEAGGLKLFLLESLRFVMIEDHVGLMKHAVSLLSLNPSAYEFLPKFQDSGPWGYNEESMATIPVQPNQVQVCPGLPSPYVYPVFTLNANGVAGADDNFHNNYDPVNLEDLDLYIGDVDEQGPWETLEHVNHSIQITLKELGLFRQKLEEEVKKDQQEKKENQDILKTLKAEIKELAESQESISKSIHEKNKEYETCLNNFLELSNQSATEKMSLEDEIKRCRDSCAKATRRSQGAELSVLENRRERSLRCLYKFLSDTKAILAQLKEGATRWELAKLTTGQSNAPYTAQYQEQMEQVKRGTRLCTLPLVAVPSIPQAPTIPVRCSTSRPLASQPNSVYEKIVGRLRVMFPHYSRDVLCKFIGEMRTENGGTLSSLSYEEVINRVAQLILDHQDTTRVRNPKLLAFCLYFSPFSGMLFLIEKIRSTGTPPPAHVWKTGVANKRSQSKALNLEDPCIICHDEMSREDLCVLECRHSFHRECIKSWLKEQSTCPTCREHVLLPEDFPLLPGRIRKSFMPATFS
uniref:RING-type E3 ubiquitin transferase n=1 Tax=Esox lucius TaxID=8010 RepID=A0A3P9A2U6_ESOLU